MADERIEVTKEQLLAMTPDEVRAAYLSKTLLRSLNGQELLSVLTPTFFREHPEAGSAGCVMKSSDWKRFQHEHGQEWCEANFALCPHSIVDDVNPPTMGDFLPEGVASVAILHRPEEPALDAPAIVEGK